MTCGQREVMMFLTRGDEGDEHGQVSARLLREHIAQMDSHGE
jgi:hypothetical protein